MAVEYRCYRNYAAAVGYVGHEERVVIAAEYGGKPVRELSANLFSMNQVIEAVFIPDSLEVIDSGVFYGCEHLAYIGPAVSGKLPDCSVFHKNLRRIGSQAFQRTALKNLVFLEKGSLCIEEGAFAHCPLEIVTMDCEELELKGKGIFQDSGICLLFAPWASCWELPDMTFAGCKRLNMVDLSFSEVGSQCFYRCKSLKALPRGKHLSYIGVNAFLECGISEAKAAGLKKKRKEG